MTRDGSIELTGGMEIKSLLDSHQWLLCKAVIYRPTIVGVGQNNEHLL